MNLKDLTENVELVSASYAKKFAIERSDAWFLLKLSEELGELNQSYLKLSNNSRPNTDDKETLGSATAKTSKDS